MKNHKKQRSQNDFDRIIKENAESIFLPFIIQILNLEVVEYKNLNPKIQRTLEREMGLLYQVKNKCLEEYILHIEFQSTQDYTMRYRMAEYHGIALRKFRLPIRHVVIYLGPGEFKGHKRLNDDHVFSGFEIINLSSFNARKLLQEQIPEVVLMAILGDLSKERIEPFLRLIIHRLKQLSDVNGTNKYYQQLLILSKLRNLDQLTYQTLGHMPISIDLETHVLYEKGLEQGQKQGLEQGVRLGQQQMLERFISAGLEQNMSLEQIQRLTKLKTKKLKQIIDQIKSKNGKSN